MKTREHKKIQKAKTEARNRDKQICSVIQLIIAPVVLLLFFWDYIAWQVGLHYKEGMNIGQVIAMLYLLLIIYLLERLK